MVGPIECRYHNDAPIDGSKVVRAALVAPWMSTDGRANVRGVMNIRGLDDFQLNEYMLFIAADTRECTLVDTDTPRHPVILTSNVRYGALGNWEIYDPANYPTSKIISNLDFLTNYIEHFQFYVGVKCISEESACNSCNTTSRKDQCGSYLLTGRLMPSAKNLDYPIPVDSLPCYTQQSEQMARARQANHVRTFCRKCYITHRPRLQRRCLIGEAFLREGSKLEFREGKMIPNAEEAASDLRLAELASATPLSKLLAENVWGAPEIARLILRHLQIAIVEGVEKIAKCLHDSLSPMALGADIWRGALFFTNYNQWLTRVKAALGDLINTSPVPVMQHSEEWLRTLSLSNKNQEEFLASAKRCAQTASVRFERLRRDLHLCIYYNQIRFTARSFITICLSTKELSQLRVSRDRARCAPTYYRPPSLLPSFRALLDAQTRQWYSTPLSKGNRSMYLYADYLPRVQQFGCSASPGSTGSDFLGEYKFLGDNRFHHDLSLKITIAFFEHIDAKSLKKSAASYVTTGQSGPTAVLLTRKSQCFGHHWTFGHVDSGRQLILNNEKLLLDMWTKSKIAKVYEPDGLASYQLGNSYDRLHDGDRDMRGDERYTALTSHQEALRLDAET